MPLPGYCCCKVTLSSCYLGAADTFSIFLLLLLLLLHTHIPSVLPLLVPCLSCGHAEPTRGCPPSPCPRRTALSFANLHFPSRCGCCCLVLQARWANEGLPTDPLSVENGAIMTNASRWALMIDPQLQGIKWIMNREEQNGLVIIQQSQNKYIDKVREWVRGKRAR